MSKRSGGFARPDDVYDQGHDARVLRYALLAAHYRAPLDFSEASLATAASAVERLSTCLGALDAYREDRPDDPSVSAALDGALAAFRDALDDDLNIAPALAAVFELVRDLNRRIADRSMSTGDSDRAAATLRRVDRVLAVAEPAEEGQEATTLGVEVEKLLAERAAARAARDWRRADAIRERLTQMDILVEDTADGQRLRRATETARA